MWGLILCVIVAIGLGIREIPALDPREYVGRDSNIPIELWVELRDQHDMPLVQHAVEAHLVQWHNGPKRETEMKTTDHQGRLHLVGRHHCGIVLELDPQMYVSTHLVARWYTSPFATNLREDEYRTDWGTAEHPTICRVLRKEGPQPLTEVWGKVSIPHAEGPFYIDLKNARVTNRREDGDIEIIVELGDVTKEANPPLRIDPDTGYVPGAVTYSEKTMWVRAVDGWIEEIPKDFNWYAKYVHAAFPHKPVESVRPRNNRAHDFGFIDEQVMYFGSRDGQIHGKFCLSVWTTYGPSPDVIVWFRGVVNATGSKSFEYTPGSIRPIPLEIAPGMIPEGYTVRPVASKPAAWDEVFRVYAQARNPERQ